jgi:aspartate/methionine/tyrosine aminotransferase
MPRSKPATRTTLTRRATGIAELLADQLSERGTATFAAEDVLITHGGTGGLAAAILAIVDPGDTVVIPTRPTRFTPT